MWYVYHMVMTLHSRQVANEAPGTAGPRERLLEAVIAHIAARGVSDLSLRELAALGTSHRMLIYHPSVAREGLLVAVVRAVEDAPSGSSSPASPPRPASPPPT